MNPFFVFVGFVALLAVALLWVADRADLGDTLTEHAKTYARSYAKGAALVTISVFIAFDESFRNLTKEAAADMSWWQWASLYIKPTVAGLSVFVAFLDRSVADAAGRHPPVEPDDFPTPPPVVPPPEAEHFAKLPAPGDPKS